MKKSAVYLVNNTLKWIPEAFVVKFSDLLNAYASEGAIFIYLITKQTPDTPFEKGSSGFRKSLTWKSYINDLRKKQG